MEREPRDSYKYWLVDARDERAIMPGITIDLDRREAEHQRRWPGSRVRQVGLPVTRRSALKWLHQREKTPFVEWVAEAQLEEE
jgi:hypothetical protein